MRRDLGAVLAVAAVACGLAACGGDGEDAGREAVAEAFGGFIGGVAGIDTGGLFSEPSDVAVYSGGNDNRADDQIFVVEADAGRSARVQRLDHDGNFELAWGADVVREGAPGDSGTGPESCRVASACKAAPPSSAAGGFRMPTAIAVNEATGALYVMDTGNRRVQQFTRSGRFVRAWGWGVASGAPRFEVCASDCRPGRIGGAEGNANPGQFARVESGGIDVRQGQGDVFATDGANRRVLQFTASGRFVRAWGWDDDRRWVTSGDWPRHVAVDRDGIIYGSDASLKWRIVRFDADDRELLPPLRTVTHTSLGMEVDPAGNLVVTRDRAGPASVNVIPDPGVPDPGGPRHPSTLRFEGFVSSMNGLGVDPTTGNVYLAKSEDLYPLEPSSDYDGCPARGGVLEHCHGLIVVTTRGRPRAALDTPRRAADGTVVLAGAVTTPGTVSYRFELSRDGGPWQAVGRARYLTAAEAQRVETTLRDLAPGAYRARLRLVQATPSLARGVRVASPVRELR